MHHPHEPIMYSRNKFHRTEKIPHQCYFKAGDAEIRKNMKYSNFLHTYCAAGHAIYISDRHSVTSTINIFNVTIKDWFDKNSLKHQEAFQMQKKEQCAQGC